MRLLVSTLMILFVASMGWAAELGDDGLHKTVWMRNTFKDMREDLASANAEGKRLMILVEQRGCIYCNKMHEEVFPVPDIRQYIIDHYFVVQLNMFGDLPVTDFDGQTLPEKQMARKWRLMFTPTLIFLPEHVPAGKTVPEAAVTMMPGAFGKYTTRHLLHWIVEKGYLGDEPFQKYHARMLRKEKG